MGTNVSDPEKQKQIKNKEQAPCGVCSFYERKVSSNCSNCA